MSPGYGHIIRQCGIVPKKRLGQHFMIDPKLLRAVAEAMVPGDSWVAVEIGSGLGTLTRELCQRAAWVYAIEKDRDLSQASLEICSGLGNLTWIWGDALDYDLSGNSVVEAHPGLSVVLCGNLPYYVTSEILYRALIGPTRWNRISVVVQEEVGERITAAPGSRAFGRLSLWCQYRGKVAVEKWIPRGAFLPRPAVDSCLVSIDVYQVFPLTSWEEQALDVISKRVFSSRRKTIANGLYALLSEKQVVMDALDLAGIKPDARPEDLGVEAFVALSRALAPVLGQAKEAWPNSSNKR